MEWEKQQQEQQKELQQTHQDPPSEGPDVNSGGISGNGGGSGMFVYHFPMMTDEQLQVLARQIAAYSTICEQLESLHRHVAAASASSHTDYSTGGFMLRNNPYFTPLMMMACSRDHNRRRKRWSPTAEQLQILESVFERANETLSKEKVKEVTAQLVKHGQVVESNVHNWFQNRRSRLKKKQQMMSADDSER